LEAHTTPCTPTKEKEQRDKTTITSIKINKSLGEECERLCEESTHIWRQLMVNPKMKEIKERVRSGQGKAQKSNERINTLPVAEHMTTILVNIQLYNEIEQMREE
jgi:hypothetical protein